MQVTKAAVLAALFTASSRAAITEGLGVEACLAEANAKYCLNRATLTDSCCWDTTAAATTPAACYTSWAAAQAGDTDGVAAATSGPFCINTAAPLNNKLLTQALDPASSTKCPTSAQSLLAIGVTGDAGKKWLIDENGFDLEGSMPAADWADYSCKVLITSAAALTEGYLYLIPEQFGFNRWVKVIVQPQNSYNDFNPRDQTSNPNEMTKLFVSRRNRRFLIPDEYDILIDFEPQNGDSAFNEDQQNAVTKGNFRVSASHVTQAEATTLSTSTDKPIAGEDIELQTLIEYIERLPTNADGVTYERIVKDDQGTEFETLASDDQLPTKVVSSTDGGAPEWFTTIYNDEALFTVGGREITKKETFMATTGTLLIILICVAICLGVSFYKRKRIAAEARRASNYVRRSTATLRASIRKARGKPTPEDEAKPMTETEINKVANEQGANKGEKEMLKDMMTAQNDPEQAEGGSFELSKINKVVPK